MPKALRTRLVFLRKNPQQNKALHFDGIEALAFLAGVLFVWQAVASFAIQQKRCKI